MKVSDYLVQFLENRGITDIFGLPGVGCGHFMNSLIGSGVRSHLVYHEQAAAFAACGYAQAAHKTGFAYTTAGPGGTNLLTGIANAYCDSIPVVFMVGEKDLSSLRGSLPLRQKASQEVDIVSMAKPVTKWSYQVRSVEEIRSVMEQAFFLAETGRPGPVLLDIPSDLARAEAEIEVLPSFQAPAAAVPDLAPMLDALSRAEKPLLLIGGGVKQCALELEVAAIARQLQIPLVTSLPAFDLLAGEENQLGFIGLDGDTAANRAVSECDLLLTLGARLNFKQAGLQREAFAPKAKVIRVDIDPGELEYPLRDELTVCADIKDVIPALDAFARTHRPFDPTWVERCKKGAENAPRRAAPNAQGALLTAALLARIPEHASIVVDTGSHRRWVMAEHRFRGTQRLFQSAGLATMGYALPAAIGIYYALRQPVVCIDGDGGLMMNLQELQQLRRDHLPVTVVVMNNRCYGDIMEFQKKIFHGQYFATTEESGYLAADFAGIAKAFHMQYLRIADVKGLETLEFDAFSPGLIEVTVPDNASLPALEGG